MTTQITFAEGYKTALHASWDWHDTAFDNLLGEYGAGDYEEDQFGGVELSLFEENDNGEMTDYLQPGDDANSFLAQVEEIDAQREKVFVRKLAEIFEEQTSVLK